MDPLLYMSFFDPIISCCCWSILGMYYSPVDVSADWVNIIVVVVLSIDSSCVCLVARAVLGCISFGPCGSVRVGVGLAIVGLGGLKSGLTLNHVSPVHGCPSNVLLACVGSKLWSCSSKSSCSISPLELDMLLVVVFCVVSHWLLYAQMSLSRVTHLAPVGVIVTGEIAALIPWCVSTMSNGVLIGVPVVFTVR